MEYKSGNRAPSHGLCGQSLFRSHWLSQHPAESLEAVATEPGREHEFIKGGAALGDGITKGCVLESQRGLGNHVLISSPLLSMVFEISIRTAWKRAN